MIKEQETRLTLQKHDDDDTNCKKYKNINFIDLLIGRIAGNIVQSLFFFTFSIPWFTIQLLQFKPANVGTAEAQWLRCCATNRKVAGSIPASVNGVFIEIKSFRSHYGPGVDSASNRNEYQDYFLWVKVDCT